MTVLKTVLFVSTISLAAGIALICNDCKLITPERCRNFKNVPTKECEEISEEVQLNMSIKPVCVLATRIINNNTFFTRLCGVKGGENDTCSFLEDKYEDEGKGSNFTCKMCDKDKCNGSPATSHVNLIALVVATLAVAAMRLH